MDAQNQVLMEQNNRVFRGIEADECLLIRRPRLLAVPLENNATALNNLHDFLNIPTFPSFASPQTTLVVNPLSHWPRADPQSGPLGVRTNSLQAERAQGRNISVESHFVEWSFRDLNMLLAETKSSLRVWIPC